jgi:hypothetical protein
MSKIDSLSQGEKLSVRQCLSGCARNSAFAKPSKRRDSLDWLGGLGLRLRFQLYLVALYFERVLHCITFELATNLLGFLAQKRGE